MGKEKKKINFGIKTTRYFTKNCTKCGFEYPSWFTNCPKCGASWEELEAKTAGTSKETPYKNVKIVAKLTEEGFDQEIEKVQLVFSADQGKSWYKMNMNLNIDYYIAEIAEVRDDTIIIYYIEVYLVTGEKIVENNDGKFFYYKVGSFASEQVEQPTQIETSVIKENLKQLIPNEKVQFKANINQAFQNKTLEQKKEDLTAFGKSEAMIDQDLKLCPHCNSKIKRMWSICPICGYKT